jgi:hypothetical protein
MATGYSIVEWPREFQSMEMPPFVKALHKIAD